MNIDWKWGMLAALAITLLGLYPQLHLLVHERGKWGGSYAFVDTDEVAYSAYLQALIENRPRKCNPYTGTDHENGQFLPESLFSIQFAPAYLGAIPGRLLHLSASSVFIVLIPIASAGSALALFWFLARVTNHNGIACAGVIAVLCLPTLVSAEGPIGAFFGSVHGWTYLTFLRRYVPAIPFPFFLLVFGLVWISLITSSKTFVFPSMCTGLCIAFLVFSYFYLWTAAVAWLVCITLLWIVARPTEWKRCAYMFSIVSTIVISAIISYSILLSRRFEEMDRITALVHSRTPDLVRPSELLSIGLLLVLVRLLVLGRLLFRNPEVLFALSLLLTPILLFNQQIITGRSLQPFHYERFVTSYTFLMALLISWRMLIVAGLLSTSMMSRTIMTALAIFSFVYGGINSSAISRAALEDNVLRDRSRGVAERLKQLSDADPGMILSLNPRLGDSLPSFATLGQLWAAHMAVFPGLAANEMKERFYQFLYYSDVTPTMLQKMLMGKDYMAVGALFGYEREAAHLTQHFMPLTPEEVGREIRFYSDYVNSFDRATAGRYTLRYLVVSSGSDSKNVDRWYERQSSEQVGDFIIYQLKLRP